jgi:hypothetical protein
MLVSENMHCIKNSTLEKVEKGNDFIILVKDDATVFDFYSTSNLNEYAGDKVSDQ